MAAVVPFRLFSLIQASLCGWMMTVSLSLPPPCPCQWSLRRRGLSPLSMGRCRTEQPPDQHVSDRRREAWHSGELLLLRSMAIIRLSLAPCVGNNTSRGDWLHPTRPTVAVVVAQRMVHSLLAARHRNCCRRCVCGRRRCHAAFPPSTPRRTRCEARWRLRTV